MARWLSQRFPRPPEEYQGGRQEIADAIRNHLACSSEEAERVVDELERAGHLRYAAEARSPGGSAGSWVVYPSPAENPDELSLGRAVSEPRGDNDTASESGSGESKV